LPTATSQVVFAIAGARLRAAIYGKEEAIQLALITLLARGHLLIEDVPGVGKNHPGTGACKNHSSADSSACNSLRICCRAM